MKRIVFLTIAILLIIYIISSLHAIYDLWQKQSLLSDAQNQLSQAQKQNVTLQRQLIVVEQPGFVEEQARDKLFFVKPGEKTVIIPSSLLARPQSASLPKGKGSNWQQWIVLFF